MQNHKFRIILGHTYSRVHIVWTDSFPKLLKKPFILQKKWYLIWKPRLFWVFIGNKHLSNFYFFEKKHKLADKKNSFSSSRPFWLFFSKKRFCFCFFQMKTTLAFILGIIFFCTMDGFFRILEMVLSEQHNCNVLKQSQKSGNHKL